MLFTDLAENGHFVCFQDLYRVLLEAESEGILDDVDMTEVEKLILGSKSAGVGRPHYSGSAELKKVFSYKHSPIWDLISLNSLQDICAIK